MLVCSVPGSVLSALRAFSYLIFTDVPFDHIRGGGSRSQHCRHTSIVISTLILRMRKLNLREVKSPAKGHTAYVVEPKYEPSLPEMPSAKESQCFPSALDSLLSFQGKAHPPLVVLASL